jgi:hypothetical protein
MTDLCMQALTVVLLVLRCQKYTVFVPNLIVWNIAPCSRSTNQSCAAKHITNIDKTAYECMLRQYITKSVISYITSDHVIGNAILATGAEQRRTGVVRDNVI